jgi:hypothetical protein
MMKRRLVLAVGVVFLLGTLGCLRLEGYLDIAREKGLSGDYLTVLQKWTRSQVIYSQFETKVHISATCRSEEFNRAYLKEYARIYQLSEEERKKQEAIRDAMTADFREFIFYATIPEKTSNDFDRRGSVWSIFLINGQGERIDPVEVRRIEPITPVVTEFFPYINPYYGNAYRLRFPPLKENGLPEEKRKLVFTGVVGRVELEYGRR